jgi:thermostable 8-oxoguanine DNA glycosylase
MTKAFERKLNEYLHKTDLEQILTEFGTMARKRKHYNKREFMAICLWKSSRQKNNYKINSQEDIRSITRDAFRNSVEKDRIKTLCKLKGVGVPVASALLTFYNPQKYAIIDIRCVEILFENGEINWTRISPGSWVKYLDTVTKLAKHFKLTPRKFEKVLFAYHRASQMEEDYKNVYK